MQRWPPELGPWTHRDILMCFSLFGRIHWGDTWDPVSFSLWQQSMGQCGYSFPLYAEQSSTEALCAVSQTFSSSSSFLPSTRQHGEQNILLTIRVRAWKTLSSRNFANTGLHSLNPAVWFPYLYGVFIVMKTSLDMLQALPQCLIRDGQFLLPCCGPFKRELIVTQGYTPFPSFFISFV